ncbi:MAG: acetolactate decarboxylase [Kiritimatiellaeota bacterium]|nr:acetolactate decarboxylase [Kiritimatiellota bacterium]
MKKHAVGWGLLLLLALQPAVVATEPATLFQTAPIAALLAGVYDDVFTLGELRRHGDFGLGTLTALDGEMIVLEGCCYQVRADGQVRVLPDTNTTPFAAVTFFKPTRTTAPLTATNLLQVCAALDRTLPSANLFYAVCITGRFDAVTTRSVPRQRRPYPPLATAAREQAVFHLGPVEGTLLGFRCPAFVKGLNVPGYHFHFLTADRQAGGHVLDVRLAGLCAAVQELRDFRLTLPATADFTGADLSADRQRELQEVEK